MASHIESTLAKEGGCEAPQKKLKKTPNTNTWCSRMMCDTKIHNNSIKFKLQSFGNIPDLLVHAAPEKIGYIGIHPLHFSNIFSVSSCPEWPIIITFPPLQFNLI